MIVDFMHKSKTARRIASLAPAILVGLAVLAGGLALWDAISWLPDVGPLIEVLVIFGVCAFMGGLLLVANYLVKRDKK
jgi:hypothetical protein